MLVVRLSDSHRTFSIVRPWLRRRWFPREGITWQARRERPTPQSQPGEQAP